MNKEIYHLTTAQFAKLHNVNKRTLHYLHTQKLKDKYLVDISEYEKLNYCNLKNEKCNNINLYEIEFEHCKFNNCKVSGCNFAENRLYNVEFIETNASYMNYMIWQEQYRLMIE